MGSMLPYIAAPWILWLWLLTVVFKLIALTDTKKGHRAAGFEGATVEEAGHSQSESPKFELDVSTCFHHIFSRFLRHPYIIFSVCRQ